MAAPRSEQQGFLTDRLGLPRMAQHRNLASAAVIDSLGSGMLLAFIVVYFAQTTSLSLPAIGAAITIARLIAVPTAVLVGPLSDRIGPRRTALTGNMISAVGYAGFLVADSAWKIVVVTLLTQVGAVTYWTTSNGLVALAAQGTQRTRWFAMLHMLRNVGLGLGGALGALLVGFDGSTGLRILVAANVLSYLVAALLLARWKPDERKPEPSSAETPDLPAVGYRTVLRDRRYMLLVAINVSFVFAALVLSLLLGVYIIEGLGEGAWIAGALLVLNSVQVALTQTAVSRAMERFRATRVIAISCLINAVAFGLFAVLVAAPPWAVIAGLFAATVLYTTAETTATPLYENLSVTLAPDHMRGRYLAVYQLSWTLGQTTAPALLTFLLAAQPWWPWLFLGVLSVAAAPAVLVLEKMVHGRQTDRPVVTQEPVAQNT
ncbi:MFS transporter [Micromonospora sp. NPDC005979]|uniref:MFS transporter n=1 Tax=Micromonospora sp. NPDC005979 TaxID=3156726 RepID=UPI0033ADBDC0